MKGEAIYPIPQLRKRIEDIEVLSEYYLKQMNRRYQREIIDFSVGGMKAMIQHPWPGNVRELIHRIERAVIMAMGKYIDEKDLGLKLRKFKKLRSLQESKDIVEKESILQALIDNQWNITRASRVLGITQKTLRRLIKKYNFIKPEQYK